MSVPRAVSIPAIRRLGVAVSITDGDELGDRRWIEEIADGAVGEAGLTAAALNRQEEPDGTVVYLATGLDEPRVIDDLTFIVTARTHRANERRRGRDRLRVRLAFDQGIAGLDDGRFVGELLRILRVLCAADLRPQPDPRAGDVLVFLSPQLHREVVDNDRWGIRASSFRPVTARAADGLDCPAWVDIPRFIDAQPADPRP